MVKLDQHFLGGIFDVVSAMVLGMSVKNNILLYPYQRKLALAIIQIMNVYECNGKNLSSTSFFREEKIVMAFGLSQFTKRQRNIYLSPNEILYLPLHE
jgi:hypothetical protein